MGNKKQLIVAGAMVILMILSIVFPISVITDYINVSSTYRRYVWEPLSIILIIGGLLIYILRDKKK